MAKKKSDSRATKKKKSWFTIVAPSVFNDMVIGETTAVEAESLVGRTVKVSMMHLTRNMKKQNISVTFKIFEIKDNKAITYVHSMDTNQASIKRVARRRRDKLEDSIVCKTKDEKVIRVKPMVMTRANNSNSAQTELRHAIRAKVIADVTKLTYGQFIDKVVNDSFAKDIKFFVQKVSPIRMVTVRAFKLADGTKMPKLTELVQSDVDSFNSLKQKVANANARRAAKKAAYEKAAAEKAAERAAEKAAAVEKEAAEKAAAEKETEAPAKEEAEEAPAKQSE